jgi:hypothetical protein
VPETCRVTDGAAFWSSAVNVTWPGVPRSCRRALPVVIPVDTVTEFGASVVPGGLAINEIVVSDSAGPERNTVRTVQPVAGIVAG